MLEAPPPSRYSGMSWINVRPEQRLLVHMFEVASRLLLRRCTCVRCVVMVASLFEESNAWKVGQTTRLQGGEQLVVAAGNRGDGLRRQEPDLNHARLCVACLGCYWRPCFIMRLTNSGRLDVRRNAVRTRAQKRALRTRRVRQALAIVAPTLAVELLFSGSEPSSSNLTRSARAPRDQALAP